jgi:hypothetical protein
LCSKIVETTTAKPRSDLGVVDTSSTAAGANNAELMISTQKTSFNDAKLQCKLPSMLQATDKE